MYMNIVDTEIFISEVHNCGVRICLRVYVHTSPWMCFGGHTPRTVQLRLSSWWWGWQEGLAGSSKCSLRGACLFPLRVVCPSSLSGVCAPFLSGGVCPFSLRGVCPLSWVLPHQTIWVPGDILEELAPAPADPEGEGVHLCGAFHLLPG